MLTAKQLRAGAAAIDAYTGNATASLTAAGPHTANDPAVVAAVLICTAIQSMLNAMAKEAEKEDGQ